jgi:hypothetical protein
VFSSTEATSGSIQGQAASLLSVKRERKTASKSMPSMTRSTAATNTGQSLLSATDATNDESEFPSRKRSRDDVGPVTALSKRPSVAILDEDGTNCLRIHFRFYSSYAEAVAVLQGIIP